MDLIAGYKEVVNDEFVDKFKTYIGEEQGDLSACLDGVFYTFLAGLIKKTNSQMSTRMLFSQLQKNLEVVDLPQNLSSIFSLDHVMSKIENIGSKIVSQIFPAYRSPLLSLIGRFAGTGKTSTLAATNIIANVMVSLFKEKSMSDDWDQDEMVDVLLQHHSALFEKAPEGFLEMMIPALGLQDLNHMKEYMPKKEKRNKVIHETQENLEVQDAVYSDTSSISKHWVPILIISLLALGGLGYYFYMNKGGALFQKKEIPVESVEEYDEVEADSADILNEENGYSALFTEMKNYLADNSSLAGKEFNLEGLNFQADSVSLAESLTFVIDNLYEMMNTNPNLQFRITASSENNDRNINVKRAFGFKNELIKKGISEIRLDPVSGSESKNLIQLKVVKK